MYKDWIHLVSFPDCYLILEWYLYSFIIIASKKREVLPDLAPMLWHSFGK